MRFIHLLLLLASLLFTTCSEGDRQSSTLDRLELESTETLSESFANRLLELSVAVRDGESEGLHAYFSPQLQAIPFPTVADSLVRDNRWVVQHAWKKASMTLAREPFLVAWSGFMDHFSEVEDVRFKLVRATPTDLQISARVSFYLVGRDILNRKEWVRAWIELSALREDSEADWMIFRFELSGLNSKLALQDLFSEVAVPAGLDTLFPAYGTAGNDTAFWHGAAAADVNNDGLIDVYATGVEANFLWLNQGDGTFVDGAEATWCQTLPPTTAPLFLDYDNDGDVDLFVASPVSQVLLENRLVPDGKLEFIDVSQPAGVSSARALGFSAVAADVNGDGFSDIYVCSYNRYGLVMPNSWHAASNGTPNLLFINQGDGSFVESAQAWGVADRRWSYAAAFADFDDDGDQDLYVANDYGENGFFINEGDHFCDQASRLGVLDPGNGMGVSFGDYDNDGDLDLHVTNMSSTAGNRILGRLFEQQVPEKDVLVKLAAGNSLYENLGDGSFRASHTSGNLSAGWAWGGGFLDFDNDGWEDLYTPNGFVSGKSMKDT